MIHTVKGFGIVNKVEVDVFLELSCFLDDPVDVGQKGKYLYDSFRGIIMRKRVSEWDLPEGVRAGM